MLIIKNQLITTNIKYFYCKFNLGNTKNNDKNLKDKEKNKLLSKKVAYLLRVDFSN